MSIIIKARGLQAPFIDVPNDYIYRFLKINDINPVDKDDEFLIEGRNCYWDIETDGRNLSSNNMKFQEMATMPIVSITTYDNYENEYYEFVWHKDFEENIKREYDDYIIPDNVLKDKDLKIDKIIRYECTSEKQMLIEFFNYFNEKKFDYMFGFFSVGGWSKFGGKKQWIDGFDSLSLYQRAKTLGLMEEIQVMSTCPQMYGYKGRYDAVYMRNAGGKHELVIKGVSQIDFVFAEKILMFAQKYYKFRGHKLSDWARFFLGYNKLDKQEKHVWEYWEQLDFREIDNYDPELHVYNGLPRLVNKGLEFMLDYNLIDVKICVDLDKYFNVTEKMVGRTEVSISPADDGLTASKLHDHFKLTHYQDQYSFDSKYQKFRREGINGKDFIGDKFTISLKTLEEKARARNLKVEYNTLKDIGKAGGFVPVPLGRGIYHYVAVIDFSKFYPNMIKSTNAGIVSAIDVKEVNKYNVIDKNGKIWDKDDLIETPIAFFRKDVKSLNAMLFDAWMGQRVSAQARLQDYMDEYHTTKSDKYKMLWTEQMNIKNFMNAGFGVLGLSIDRTYSKLCFNSCTLSCQDVLMKCMNLMREIGITIIGGDTDSLFILLNAKDLDNAIDEAKGYCDILNIKIDEYMKDVYNVDEHTIKIDLETISDKFYVDTMKHYIKRNLYAEGVKLEKPELEIKGMDLKKRATSVIGAELQEALIDIIFESDKAEYDIKEFLLKFDRQLRKRRWIDVCKRGPLNKQLDKYPDTNQSAMAARNSLKYMNKYYTPGSNPFLGVFKEHPEFMNGKFLNGNGNGKDFVLSFDREDEFELKKLGFVLNYARIRDTECHNKTKHLLSIFNTNYYDIIESAEEGDGLLI